MAGTKTSYDELIEQLRFFGKYRKETEARSCLHTIYASYPHMAARATAVFAAYFNPNR